MLKAKINFYSFLRIIVLVVLFLYAIIKAGAFQYENPRAFLPVQNGTKRNGTERNVSNSILFFVTLMFRALVCRVVLVSTHFHLKGSIIFSRCRMYLYIDSFSLFPVGKVLQHNNRFSFLYVIADEMCALRVCACICACVWVKSVFWWVIERWSIVPFIFFLFFSLEHSMLTFFVLCWFANACCAFKTNEWFDDEHDKVVWPRMIVLFVSICGEQPLHMIVIGCFYIH